MAVIVSVISLYATISNQAEQNRRWEALNLGRIDLTDESFTMFKELSKEELGASNWGYIPFAFPRQEGRVMTERMQLPYELVLWDANNKRRLPLSNGFFKLPQAQLEFARLGINASHQSVQVLKHYQVVFEFKNTGSTTVSDFEMNITVESPTKDAPLSVFNSRSRPDLLPGGTGNAAVDFYSPINEMLPEIMNFKVSVKYKDIRGQRTARYSTYLSFANRLLDTKRFLGQTCYALYTSLHR